MFAHEDLDSTQCQFKEQTITVEKTKDNRYKIQTPGMKNSKVFPKPTPKDVWDPKRKQTFDTYTFADKNFKLIIKRPETKGPVKNKIAMWNNMEFNCK